MKIAYSPYRNKKNKYIEISQEAIELGGNEIVDLFGLKFKEMKEVDAICVNWFESIFSNKIHIKIGHFIKRNIILGICRKNNIRIITTFHNRKVHDDNGFYGFLENLLLKRILKVSDKIIIISNSSKALLKDYLSDEEIEKKAFYIPHPNYIGAYSEPTEKIETANNDRMNILFFGQVREYKNVEFVIEAARMFEEIDFTIAGGYDSEQYRDKILSMSKECNNLRCMLHFIDDSDLEQLIREHDILLLPYNMNSSMNSGTVILAFSNSRNVICPEIATVKDFDPKKIYSYSYENDDEHFCEMTKQIKRAYSDWKNNRIDFNSKGAALYEEVKDKNSRERIVSCYRELLK